MQQDEFTKLDPNLARIAGGLYLTIAVCGAFSIGYVPMEIVVAGDAAASAGNLLAQPGLFKLGVLADSIVILCELAITVILYQMFHRASPVLSLLALVSRAGMIVIMGVNLLLWVMPFALLNTPSNFAPTELENLTQMFFDAHDLGIFTWQVFFGAHLLALGLTVVRTHAVPHFLGWGLFIGAFGYLFQGVYELTFSNIPLLDTAIVGLLVIVTLAELSFAVWLLLIAPRRATSITS